MTLRDIGNWFAELGDRLLELPSTHILDWPLLAIVPIATLLFAFIVFIFRTISEEGSNPELMDKEPRQWIWASIATVVCGCVFLHEIFSATPLISRWMAAPYFLMTAIFGYSALLAIRYRSNKKRGRT